MSASLAAELQACIAGLAPQDRPLVIALSGGVDSAVVAQAAALSGRVVIAATARGPSVSAVEQQDAQRLAEAIGLEHHWIEPGEVQSAAYQRNDARRCYYCKSHLYASLTARYPEHLVLSGTNHDDLGDYRPGLQAAREADVRAPLAELGLGKAAVRELAAHWQLAVADKPASPCLASRIAFGVPVTAERLRQVEQAEQWLRTAGWREFRVRVHADELARVELPADALAELVSSGQHQALVEHFKRIGFRFVTLDLEGFRSGSLNPVYSIAPR